MKNVSNLIGLLINKTPLQEHELEIFYNAIQGNRQDLLRLVERRINLLISVLASPFRDNQDLRNESYMECCLQLRELQTPDEFYFWLACIVRSVVRDAVRADVRFFLYDDLSDGENSRDELIADYRELSSVEYANKNEEQGILAEAVGSLSEQEQVIYHLIHQEHLPQTKAAQELGIPFRTLQRRVSEIKEKLRCFFKITLSTDWKSVVFGSPGLRNEFLHPGL